MTTPVKVMVALGLLLASPAAHTAAWAEEMYLTGSVGVLSDYTERGVSLSGEDVSVTGDLSYAGDYGLFLGLSAASLSGSPFGDATAEVYGGYRIAAGAYDLDFSVAYTRMEGGLNDHGFAEIGVDLIRDLGLLYVDIGARFTPGERRFGMEDNVFYGFIDLEAPVPKTPWLTIAVHMGQEIAGNARDRTDWSLGAFISLGDFELGLAYVDTNRHDDFTDSRLTAGLRFLF